MKSEEIRSIDVHEDSDAAKLEFGLSMLQEIAAQLATMNERQIPAACYQHQGNMEALAQSLRSANSVVPFLYPQAHPARFV